MQAIEHAHSEPTTESVILDELRSAPVAATDLTQRVREKVRGLSPKQCKAALDALVVGRRIHGLAKLGKTGKPTKTIETYVLGAPPPPPPPPRERAPTEILNALRSGALSTKELKARVKAAVGALGEPDFKSVLAQLVKERKVYARPKRGKGGKPFTTIESYALEGPSAADFIPALLATWKEVGKEAADAGVTDSALLAAFLDTLAKGGLKVAKAAIAEPAADDRAVVLRSVRELVAREGQGALIPVRKLRGELELAKGRFDEAVLQLYADDAIILHHHDYVGNLSDAERGELVLDRHGNYYVGIALRGEP